jgi:hypothetical protein
MNKIMLAVILATTFTLNLAQARAESWTPLSSSMYVLRTADDEKIVLTAGLDNRNNKIIFRLLDMSGDACQEGDISDPEPLPPIKINGKYVRILSMCINGNQIEMPQTSEGRKYLYDQVMSGKSVTIETKLTPVLHFQGRLPRSAIRALMESNGAM